MWCWHGNLYGVRCKWFAFGPRDATAMPFISCIIGIQIGLTFLVLGYRGHKSVIDCWAHNNNVWEMIIYEYSSKRAKFCHFCDKNLPTWSDRNCYIEILMAENVEITPARVVRWLDHLGAMCSRVWHMQCAIGSRFNSSRGPVRCVHLRESNYVKIIPTHMMIREIIPGRQQGFDGVLYKMWPLLTSWLATSRCQPWRLG